MRKYWPFILLGLMLVAIVVIQLGMPKPLDWRKSYSLHKKTPLGGYLLFKELDQIFPGAHIETYNKTIYQTLNNELAEVHDAAFLFIGEDIFFTEDEWPLLLDFVERGNDVFLSADYFNFYYGHTFQESSENYLKDFNIDSVKIDMYNDSHGHKADQEFTLYFDNPKLRKERNLHEKVRFTSGRINSDTRNFKLIGHRSDSAVNIVRFKYGDGSFFFHANPALLTNYALLDRNMRKHAAVALSHVNRGTIIWDEYFKPDRHERENNSEFRYIFSQPALKWAFWLFIASGLLFLFFKGKREQRVIPVKKPPRNLSLEFIKTVGELYFERADYTDMAKKKVKYFKDYIAQHYNINQLIDTEESRSYFIRKTGIEENFAKNLLDRIFLTEKADNLSEPFLLDLNNIIERFYKL